MFPIVKVPCILVAMVGLQVAASPPESPSPKGEAVESTTLEFLLKKRWPPLLVKSFFWGTALAELTVLLVQHVPDYLPNYLSCSDNILRYLIFHDGAAERIRSSGLFFVGSLMTVLGGFIRFKCYKALKDMFTFEMSMRKDHKLVTSGPYRFVRHPGYTGILLTFGGLLLQHGSEGSWVRESGVMGTIIMKGVTMLTWGLVGVIITGLLRRMTMEDRALHRIAGKEWEDWARKVPYKLFPWIY